MKTLKELEALSDDDLRVMLAELDGYVRRPDSFWQEAGHVGSCGIPNYPQDLNACREVLHHITPEQSSRHTELLADMSGTFRNAIDAPARLRTIALILTLQKP